MIWTKIWNSINRLRNSSWLIILSPYTKEEIEILKEVFNEYEV